MGHESFLALSKRGALSIFDGQLQILREGPTEPWSTVRLEQRAFKGLLCLLRSDWGLRWLDVCICTDASEKGFSFAVREGRRQLASEVGRRGQKFKSSSRSIRARSRALRSIALDVVLERSSPG